MIRNILKEPLVHFALGAVLLFALSDVFWPEEGEDDPTVIEITEEDLTQYIQYQSGVFDQARAEKALAVMPAEKRDQLIERYIEEEALYREALAMGLDQNDRAIRLRLVQQASTLAEAILPRDHEPKEEEILAYYEENKASYTIDPSVTFTHVFLDPDKFTSEQGNELLEDLRSRNVPFDMAGRYGNRFLYHINYVERTPEFVSAHFGKDFAERVFSDSSVKDQWIGPLASVHGQHLVLITDRSIAREPGFDEVKSRVVGDYLTRLQEKIRKGNIRKVVDRYQVILPESMTKNEAGQ